MWGPAQRILKIRFGMQISIAIELAHKFKLTLHPIKKFTFSDEST